MRVYWQHYGRASSISSHRSRRRIRCGRRIRGRHCPVAEERDGVLGDHSMEDKLEDVSRCIRVARVDSVKAGYVGIMTNHEVLLKLSVDKNDHLAVTSLLENNAEIIRMTVVRYFGTGTFAEGMEFALLERMADHARLYEDSA